jgi:hypothetical protein
MVPKNNEERKARGFDMSLSGIAFEVDRPLDTGQNLIVLVESAAGGGGRRKAEGRSAMVQKTAGRPLQGRRSHTGIRTGIQA